MKRAIVIGATSGIGRGLAECFAAQGYAVGLVGRRENLLKEIAQADPAAYRFAVADVTRPAETVAALEQIHFYLLYQFYFRQLLPHSYQIDYGFPKFLCPLNQSVVF